mgnify:CR=1 FL=1
MQTTISYTLDGIDFVAKAAATRRTLAGRVTTLVSAQALEDAELEIAVQLVEVDARGPEAFTFMRKQAGYGAERLGRLFGVSKKTVLRWSNGESPVPIAVLHIVREMVREKRAGRRTTIRKLEELGAA